MSAAKPDLNAKQPDWCRGEECRDFEWCVDWHDCLVPHPDTLRSMTGRPYS